MEIVLVGNHQKSLLVPGYFALWGLFNLRGVIVPLKLITSSFILWVRWELTGEELDKLYAPHIDNGLHELPY